MNFQADGTVPDYAEYFGDSEPKVEQPKEKDDKKGEGDRARTGSSNDKYLWDEIVVAQEPQITPVYGTQFCSLLPSPVTSQVLMMLMM